MKRENTNVTNLLTTLVDLLVMIISFYLSAYIRGGIVHNLVLPELYGYIFTILILSSVVVGSNNNNLLKRGFFEELLCVIKDKGKLCIILLGYIFAFKIGGYYSRIFLFLLFLLDTMFSYIARSYLKLLLLLVYKKSSSSSKIMLITVSGCAPYVIREFRSEYEWKIQINSIVLWDKHRIGDKIEGVEVIADRDNLLDAAKRNIVDEVFIQLPNKYKVDLEEIILELEKMGIVVHVNLDIFNNLNVKEKTVEEFAGHQVITFSTGLFDEKKAIVKRILDIFGGIVGCIFTAVLTIFLAPVILIESPGPIFFSQIRVGKNGRKFRIYKFRSMYKDAEQRKAELMDQNEMKGQMFKISDDPRITKAGKFIRKTSLDEFPQFLNVLKGDMSLVGTRPPTEDEFEHYEARHKRRLSLKPGLTGLWQVSGRSDINNFEEVVKLDLKYIDNWSFKLDLKLILKTIGVVFRGRGSK